MQGFTQWPTYPQLLVNGELLGGCDIVMEMQQDGSLKSAVQEALGATVDDKSALQQRLKQLLDSSPVMLFMKVNSHIRFCDPQAIEASGTMSCSLSCWTVLQSSSQPLNVGYLSDALAYPDHYCLGQLVSVILCHLASLLATCNS